ncbi:MAG: DNA mismatch repair endonuclease MutL [Bacteroidota bacterium]
MSDIISLLPDSIANQIAAGEVIQRPASAVKEMMENSIDADATEIKLIIRDAGKSLIQVIDNGKGMSDTDARMSFERHATSKIKNIDDLFQIRTMGFRGEALASIAAIAQVELKTRLRGEAVGTELLIEGSEVLKQETVSCAEGASLSVKNLFYNVPARRNFLKSNPVETKHIIDEFTRIALAHPEINFQLHHNGVEVYHLNSGNLRQRIVGLFGHNYNERLVPVEEQTTVTNIIGFIGKPDAAKKTRGEQFFFVNNRFIKSAYLNHAVSSAFDELLPRESFAFYVLFLDIDPSRIDINVHPTKQEIKFEDERIIYTFILSAIKRALGKYSVSPSLDFNDEHRMSHNISFSRPNKEMIDEPNPKLNPDYSPYPQQKDARTLSNERNWKELYADTRKGEDVAIAPVTENDFASATFTIPSRWETVPEEQTLLSSEEKIHVPVQLHDKYILSAIKSGFILVEQHAAHERVLFERYLKQLNDNVPASQRQLFPQTLHLTAPDFEIAKEILQEVRALGFDVQEFGNTDLVIHGTPSDITDKDPSKLLEEIIEGYKQSMQSPQLNKREEVALQLAKQAAIKNGTRLTEREMKNLLDELFGCEIASHTADGKSTFISFNLRDIEKQFEKPV